MMNQMKFSLLRSLYEMAREDRSADLKLVADQLGLSCVQTDRLLSQLEAAGLVDTERVRLTLSGLAIAVATPSMAIRQRDRNAA